MSSSNLMSQNFPVATSATGFFDTMVAELPEDILITFMTRLARGVASTGRGPRAPVRLV